MVKLSQFEVFQLCKCFLTIFSVVLFKKFGGFMVEIRVFEEKALL